MSIITRYMLSEILKFMLIILAVLVMIYLVVDFFEKIDNFMEGGVPLHRLLVYFLLKLPFIISQMVPLCILLSVIVCFGLMTKYHELIALRSGGVSIFFLFIPILYLGLIFSILQFMLSEVIVPLTVAEANKIWREEVKKKAAVVSKGRNIWLKGNRMIIHIKYYNPAKKIISGITLYNFDSHFRISRRIDAKKGVYRKGKWVLYHTMQQKLNADNHTYTVSFHDKSVQKLELAPDDLQRVVKKSEEMSFTELLAYIKRVEREGYDATLYKVDLYAKIAFPFVCVIMTIAGTALATRNMINENMPITIAAGVGIAFLYWTLHSLLVSLGYGEVLRPVVAAWMTNFIFLASGAFFLFRSE